jgi:hypothetical protein
VSPTHGVSGFGKSARRCVTAENVLRDFVADGLRGIPQTFSDDRRANVRRFGELAYFALPAADENGAATGARGGFEIGNAVANHVAIFKRDVHVGRGLLEHGDAGLATIAFLPQLADLCFGMMQAVVDVVDVSAGFAYGGENHALEGLQRFALQVSFRDTGLIGDDRDAETEIVEEANRFRDTRKKLELGACERSVDDAGVVMIDESVDHSIAVE